MEGHTPDHELVRQTLAGDIQAFEMIVERHQQTVYRILYRLLRNKQEAEDIAQEAFLRCYRHLGKYDQDRPFAPWLYQVATNLALSRLRHLVKHQSVSWDACDHRFSETQATETGWQTGLPTREGPSRSLDPAAAWEKREARSEIIQALRSLKPPDQLIIILRYFEELSYEEIAYVMQTRRNIVEVRLFRARQRLRNIPALQQEWGNAQCHHQDGGVTACTPVRK
ncbi:MAG: sigma-70 family RNA polymerase sigma factor [Thermacetogeniaceae bacterium]